jgi:hypothetical protein
MMVNHWCSFINLQSLQSGRDFEMDKLQPLIKHRYWICFALSVVFVVVGWWMASGVIAIEIEDRMKKVDESFTKATQGATKPNKAWVDAAKKENEADTQSYDRASKLLLQRQKNARKWPDALVNSMKGISYRQDLKDTTTRARWASIYRDQIEQLLQIVKPFKNGEGLVLVDTSKISHKPFNSWRTSRPSSTEIWNCQEDIWLLESLLKSIARVNDGATRLTESQVRQIFRLHLRGGDRDAASSGGGGMGGGMGDMAGMGGMAGMSMPGGAEGGAFMPGGMGMGGSSGGAASYPGKEFEGAAGTDILTEEFGAFAAGGGAQGGMSAMGGMAGMAGMPGMGEMSMGAEAMGGMGGAPAEEKRYVDGGDGDTTLGYKTRAFLLDVLIRDEQVPNLLASLTNSDFPVEIVRVEIVSRFTPAKGAAGMTGGPGMGEIGAGSEMAGMSGMPGSAEGAGYGTTGELAYGEAGAFGSEGVGVSVGSAEYDPNALSGSGAVGMAPGMPGSGLPAGGTKGKEVIQAAMNDPLMVHVKIGGLMTLYQSAQEANAEAETAETDQAMTPTEAPAVDSTAVPGDPAAPTDPGTSPAPAEGAPTTEGTPGQDPGNPDAPASPVSPGEPAEGVSPAPAEGTPAPAATPTDPAATTPSEPAGSEATPATEAPPADPASPPEAAPPAQP